MSKLTDLKTILENSLEKSIKVQNITVYGYQYNYEYPFYKSISPYWFGTNEVEEHLAPLNSESGNTNRSGNIKTSTEYITIHDTASSSPTADEYAHATYVSNGGGGTSWHYSVGSKMACHQIPDNEVAHHAGDGITVQFELQDTGVKATTKNPLIDIKDGYFSFNGEKSLIQVPKTDDPSIVLTKDHFNDAGFRVDIKDGNYYFGTTYYNKSYQKIANRGGNLNSIGIETMLNEGSNLTRTWHRTAKLVAHLLIDNHLDPSRVKPHHYFSGKPCPMTMRNNHLYDYFMKMVEIEYQILKNYPDVKITLVPKTDIIDQEGLITTAVSQIIKYQIILDDGKEQLSFDGQTEII